MRPDPEVGLYGRIPAAGDDEPGRDEALDVLFRRHYADLVRLAYCLLGDRPQAEDVVQDAFVALYRHSRLTPSEASRVAEALDLPLGHNNQAYRFQTVSGPSALFMSVILPHEASGAYGG